MSRRQKDHGRYRTRVDLHGGLPQSAGHHRLPGRAREVELRGFLGGGLRERRRRGIDVHLLALTIYVEFISCHEAPPIFPVDRAYPIRPKYALQRRTQHVRAAATIACFRQVAALDSNPIARAALLRDV